MNPDRAQHESDIGQEIAEHEWTTAQMLWNEYDKARAAINHEFGTIPYTVENRTELELEYSLAMCAVPVPSMPRPGPRPGASRLRPVPAWHSGPRAYWGE